MISYKKYENYLLTKFDYVARRHLVETTYGIVIYSSYHNCVFSLKPKHVAAKLIIKLWLDLFLYSFINSA